MTSVFVDAFVFSCPTPDEGIGEFDAYVRNLVAWQELRHANWLDLCLSQKTVNVLFDTNTYPLWPHLATALSQLEAPTIQARDVVSLVDALLTRLPTIESRLGIDELLIDAYTCQPSYHISARLPPFVEHYKDLTAMMCLCERNARAGHDQQILITRGLKASDHVIEITCEVLACDTARENASLKLPCHVSGRFPACIDPDGLRSLIDPVSLWQVARCEEAYQGAVEVYIYQQAATFGLPTTLNRQLPWSFGPQFVGTASQHGFVDQDEKVAKVLRALAETILEANLRSTHPLRTSSGGNAPQRRRNRDDAAAWRRDIDHDLHLHYWQTPQGLEFASIVHHNDMSIPE
jgi:hypothetical protein